MYSVVIIIITTTIIANIVIATLDERCGNPYIPVEYIKANAVKENPHPAKYGWMDRRMKNMLTTTKVFHPCILRQKLICSGGLICKP